jgi:hypothetical protein
VATFIIPLPFDDEDVVRFGNDSRSLFLVRSQPYRLDRFDLESRQLLRGREIKRSRVLVTQSDRDSVVAEAAGRAWQGAQYAWKTDKPPFAAASALVDHNGRVWLRVERAPGVAQATYDVLTQEGRTAQVMFTSPSTRVVALDRDALILAKQSADGDYVLQRVSLPRALR